jgi:hypothetical protein
MRMFLRRKPSASMVIAVIALVVAASGTAVAATKLVNGDKLIKKHSLSGNRLINKTLTGTQINLKKLGTVPSATKATTAGTATTATNALALDGQAPSSFASASSIARSGTVVLTAGQAKILATSGDLGVGVVCASESGGVTQATLDLTSSVPNWVYSGVHETSTTPVQVEQLSDNGSVGSFEGTNDSFQALAPSGQIQGFYMVGVNWPAAGDCFYNLSSLL